MTVNVVTKGPASMVSLDHGPLNLLNIDIMDALVEAHQQADADPNTRVILTCSKLPNMFSNGLDPKYLLSMPKAERTAVFAAVGRLVKSLFMLSKPHIAVINGPAMAGGAVLAITADFRFIHATHGRICFAEPKVGLPIPAPIIEIIAHFCTPPMLREVALLGKNMDAATCVQAGLADGMAESAEDLEALVAKQIARLARLSPAVLKTIKREMRKPIYPALEAFANHPGQMTPFMGPAFLEEGLRAVVEQRPPVFTQ